ncbi:MAG: hypothetical protein AAFX50_16450, partial [Acidobacteriota bacterium]
MPIRSIVPLRAFALALAAILGGTLPSVPVAADLFLVDDDGPLYRFDLFSQDFELLGDTGINNGTLAIAPDGRLYSASSVGLHRIDAGDGSSTLIAPWGETLSVTALAFDPSGELFMVAGGDLFAVDP